MRRERKWADSFFRLFYSFSTSSTLFVYSNCRIKSCVTIILVNIHSLMTKKVGSICLSSFCIVPVLQSFRNNDWTIQISMKRALVIPIWYYQLAKNEHWYYQFGKNEYWHYQFGTKKVGPVEPDWPASKASPENSKISASHPGDRCIKYHVCIYVEGRAINRGISNQN